MLAVDLSAIQQHTTAAHHYVGFEQAGIKGQPRFDCVDFTAANVAAVLAAGVDPKTVEILIVIDEEKELHMVAQVGDQIMDQRRPIAIPAAIARLGRRQSRQEEK